MDLNHGRKPVDDLWHRTLSQIPAVYGRLVYLESLRDPNTGQYKHHGLALIFGAEAAHEALRDSHLAAFREWLTLNLEQQKADLDLYMADQPTDRRTMVENWVRLAPYRALVPAAITPPEEALFAADIEALLGVLRNELKAGARDRTG
jgi:hypothetical protein